MSDYYLVVVDHGSNDLVLAHEGSDINNVYLRIGQMAMSMDIEQIIVYRNSEEYRRYELRKGRGDAMVQDITEITVVPDSKDLKEYQRGDIGQPLKSVDNSQWLLCCPGCGMISSPLSDKIIANEDGTVSTREPLHCHGRKALQRYSIECNQVRWL